MNQAGSGVKLTYDDFVRFPDDGMRHELIDGEHYVTPSPNMRHQGILGQLYLMIGLWLETHPIGRVFFAPFDVVFTPFDVVEPDLLYLSNERAAEALTPLNVRGVPEIVVEVASPGTHRRDETIKLRLYERSGVTEYWVVDPKTAVVWIYRQPEPEQEHEPGRLKGNPEGAFAAPTELSREAGDVITTPLLPGLQMPLARLFRE